MTEQQTLALIEEQRVYASAREDGVKQRKAQLIALKNAILRHEEDIYAALKADLNKSQAESYMTELGMVYAEISHMLKHLAGYARPKKVKATVANFPSKNYILPCPYGCALILSPWNYPFQLALNPLVDAVAAGNCAIVKPSSQAPRVSEVIATVVGEAFERGKAAVVLGDKRLGAFLLEQKFDIIFYTGSIAVGQEVMKKAAVYCTPVVLEMGGKSPCIVDETANIPLAARRIVFGKLLNAGQTCVAPDYILCHASIKERLIEQLCLQIKEQYGDVLQNQNYPKIINQRQFDRLKKIIAESKVIFGGQTDDAALKIEPTVVEAEGPCMQEEIFGPILPVATFENLEQVIARVNAGGAPLALYCFSENKQNQNAVISRCRFGGGCVNDTVMHLAGELPFGGLHESGMGAYHGERGFLAFTHQKSVLHKSTAMDLPMRYQPMNDKKLKIIKKFMK